MTDMQTFLFNVLASLVAGVLLVALTALLSKHARWILTGILSLLTRSDLDFVYDNRKHFAEDIAKDFGSTQRMYVFTGKGSEIQRDTFELFLSKRPHARRIDFRVLLPEIGRRESRNWTHINDLEMGKFDAAYGKGLLADQIKLNIVFLLQYVQVDAVAVKQYSMPHFGRFILTDRFAYITPYRSDRNSRYNPIYKFKVGGAMYDSYERLFHLLWDVAAEVKSEKDIA